jgi:hypothetical protein
MDIEVLLADILKELTKTNALLQRQIDLLEISTRIWQNAEASDFENSEMQREIHGSSYARRG